jgi:DNA helicase-2/ATP-dependent DNA helicase PcrA
MEKRSLDPKMHDPNRILSAISREKGRGLSPQVFATREAKGGFSNIVEEIWTEYEAILKRDNALDFDDLLVKTRDALREYPEIGSYYRNIWHYVHIDEYQDTNRVQYEISKLLVGEKHNVCVVGDIDQNIYSWRGADIKNIMDFEKDYPEAQVILLEENYRSTKTILDSANQVIKKNTIRVDKNLFTSKGEGEKIGIFQGFDEVSEAEFIAEKIQSLIALGTPADEIAVLYRANFQSRVLEEACMKHNLPYQLLGTRFFERKEVKDIISYLRASFDPSCLADIKRIINVPTRGIGKTTIAKLFTGGESTLPESMQRKIGNFHSMLAEMGRVAKEKKPSETLSYIIKTSGMEDEWKNGNDEDAARLENAYELVNFATKYDDLNPEEGIMQFLSDAALQSDQDEMKEEVKAVRLMTVHASKGLEFDVVFISGLEDGLFPHQRMNSENLSKEAAEEERRLFYVAITRAKKKVFLTYAQMRTVFGRNEVNIPSEFVFDIPEEYVAEETFDEGLVRRKPLLEIDF